MILKNDYNRCLTNIACSVQKYFEVTCKHNGLKEIDEILERKQPKNVIVMLFDGMGDNILRRTLTEDDFFLRHRVDRITSIFPATTTAATTTIESGLNPCEHGWLGWNTYLSGIDKVACLFMESIKGTRENCSQAVIDERAYVPVVDQINNAGKYEAHNISDFGDITYDGLEDMVHKVIEVCEKPGKKYMYVYNNEPDHLMHELGPDAPEVKALIKERNDIVEKLCGQLTDSLVIVVADHGHIIVNNSYLENYPDLFELLVRPTSIEPRACSFKVKDGTQKKFEELFLKYFGDKFELLTAKEVLDMGLFGTGEYHEGFVESLGDFIAIGQDNDGCLMTKDDWPLFSQHAGYSDDEVYVPLIIVEK